MNVFTVEEKKQIKECLELIEKYLVEEYYTLKSDMFIKFGNELTLRIMQPNEGEKYEPYKDIKLFNKFNSGYGFNDGYGTTLYNKNVLDYSIQLITNWGYIKREIEQQKHEDEKIIEKLFNFEI